MAQMTTRAKLYNELENILNSYKNGTIVPVLARKSLGRIVRRLSSYVTPVDDVIFETYWSNAAAANFPKRANTEVDHAIPVATIVEDLMFETLRPQGSVKGALVVIGYSYLLVRVTQTEHKNLSRASMPACWKESNEDAWKARYISANISVDFRENNRKLVSI